MLKLRMHELPSIWDSREFSDGHTKFFTIGNGKARYDLITLLENGQNFYVYRTDEDGHACGKRLVHPYEFVYLWYDDLVEESDRAWIRGYACCVTYAMRLDGQIEPNTHEMWGEIGSIGRARCAGCDENDIEVFREMLTS